MSTRVLSIAALVLCSPAPALACERWCSQYTCDQGECRSCGVCAPAILAVGSPTEQSITQNVTQTAFIGVSNAMFGVRPLASPSTYIKTAQVGKYPEGFAEESYNGYEGQISSGDDRSLRVRGNVRTYWVKDSTKHDWSHMRYKTLDLRGKSLRFTADVSRVGCACNAALYLVGMPHGGEGGSSQYCDIQGVGGHTCLEIDLLEGNRKAIQTTLHTQTGKQSDGTCNQYGCAVNWGKVSQKYYGTGSMIDSGRPYEVDAAFDEEGHMTVRLRQDGRWHPYWNVSIAGNGRRGVPEQASRAVKQGLEKGVVLAISLWEAKDDMSWLNGNCGGSYPHCDLSSASLVFSDIRVSGDGPPPTPGPHPPPPPPPSPSKCALFPSHDCVGHDLTHKSAQTPEECCAICESTSGCTAFSHKGHDQWNPPMCYLKTACPYKQPSDVIITAGLLGNTELVESAD